MRQLLFVLAINLYLSFQMSGISWQAHIGGLFVGAAVTAAMVYPPAANRRKVQMGAVVVMVVVLVALVDLPGQPDPERCADDRRRSLLPAADGLTALGDRQQVS